MRRIDDDMYGRPEPTIAGPLFDSGPYDNSPLGKPLSPEEEIIAKTIFVHRGRKNPISIAHIQAHVLSNVSPREVKAIVWDLRMQHLMPIGAKREDPAGYFWIVDSDDRELALAPYRGQILTMWATLRALDSPEKLRELRNKMTVEAPE